MRERTEKRKEQLATYKGASFISQTKAPSRGLLSCLDRKNPLRFGGDFCSFAIYGYNVHCMQTQSNKTYFIATSVVVVLIVIAGWQYLRGAIGPSGVPTNATSTVTGSVGVTGAGGQYTVNETPVANAGSIKAPDFHAPLVIGASVGLSQDVETRLQKQYAEIEAALEKEPASFNAWISLGQLRAIAGDYAGAEADWQYMSALYPKNSISFGNLGSLYMDDIKNYPLSEREYTQAIANNPQDTNSYRALFSLYTDYGYRKESSAAPDILLQGTKNNPKAIDFYVLLARYYAGKGDTADARTQYDAAVSQAKAQNNAILASEIQAESDALK